MLWSSQPRARNNLNRKLIFVIQFKQLTLDQFLLRKRCLENVLQGQITFYHFMTYDICDLTHSISLLATTGQGVFCSLCILVVIWGMGGGGGVEGGGILEGHTTGPHMSYLAPHPTHLSTYTINHLLHSSCQPNILYAKYTCIHVILRGPK